MNQTQKILFRVGVMLSLFSNLGRAEMAMWSDGFENGASNRWTASSSAWHIGSPTAGPSTNVAGFHTHSDTNCASTQNYPYSQDARLICTNYHGTNWLVIPAANLSPRLRFWQWFNYQVAFGVSNALGYVEINTGSNNWQQISPTYEGITSGDVWSRPSIDLSPYAGKSVQVAFHFICGCCTGNNLGWYVDDVAVVTNAPVFNNPESFEAGPNTNDWAVDFGTWEIGKPTSGPNAAHTGTNCAGTVLAGNYPNNVDSRLISPSFTVPNSNSPALRFWHWYNFNNALGYVEIRIGTGSWTQLTPTYINATTGGAWTNVSLDLSSYAGQTVQAAFHFTSGGIYSAAGWFVDDITLVAKPVLTVPTTQTIYAGQSLNVTNYATLLPTNGTPLFALISPPINFTNLNLNSTSGVLTWNTTTAQPPSTNTITIKVTETNVPALSNTPAITTTNSFLIQVLSPPLPVLTGTSSQTIYAGQMFTNYYSATNPVFPFAIYTFSLENPSTNYFITTNGELAWTNTNTRLYGTYSNNIIVTDNNSPPLVSTNGLIIVVSNPPPPVLTVPTTKTIYAGQTLIVANFATNSVFPTCMFTFGISSAPANVSINSTSGILTWTNTASAAPSTNIVTVTVSDNNSPPLGATNNFKVIIKLPNPPKLTNSISFTNGFQFTLNTISNTTWRIEASTNLTTANWLPIFTNLAGPSGTLQFTDLLATNFARRFYRAVSQ